MENHYASLISVNNLCVELGKTFKLGPLSFSLKKNAILGVLGENGSGKSTLMYTIANLITDFTGEVSINADKIGFSFQTPVFYPNKTVFENLRIFSLLKKVSKSEIEEALDYFKIYQYKNQTFKTLSGGNKKRVEIILSFLGSPELILFDEPTANVDESGVELFNQLIGNLKGKSTIIINNHITSELLSYCTEFIILDNGELIEHVDQKNFKSEKYIKS